MAVFVLLLNYWALVMQFVTLGKFLWKKNKKKLMF